jgi:superfamily II DNA helicase RecQ
MICPPGEDLFEAANAKFTIVFGFEGFRGTHGDALRRLLVDRESALAHMSTGGGKSLSCQLPDLVLPPMTTIISPSSHSCTTKAAKMSGIVTPHSSLEDTVRDDVVDAVREGARAAPLRSAGAT